MLQLLELGEVWDPRVGVKESWPWEEMLGQ
jgi:hypothetical protein